MAIILAIIAVYRWVDASRTAAHERAWGDLAGATSPETLRQVASDNSSNPAVAALAQLRAGDLALSRVLNPVAAEPTSATTKPTSAIPGLSAPAIAPRSPEAERNNDLKLAEDAYNAAINVKSAPVIIQLNARLGLAAVAETRGQWAKAHEAYQAAAKAAGDEYPMIKAQAVAREALIDRLPTSLAFSPEKPPVVATQPADLFPLAPHFGVPATTQPVK